MEDKQVVSVTPRTARRTFSKQFKRKLVLRAMSPGVSLAALAQANEINANQLSRAAQQTGGSAATSAQCRGSAHRRRGGALINSISRDVRKINFILELPLSTFV